MAYDLFGIFTGLRGTEGSASRLLGYPGLVASWEFKKGVTTRLDTTGTLAGTVSTTAGSATVTGVSTNFTTTFTLGDSIVVTGGDTQIVTAVASDTSLTIASVATVTTSAVMYKRIRTLLSRWNDVSGNDYKMSQYTQSEQPVYDPINGVIFGPNAFMECFPTKGFLNGATGYSIVAKLIPGAGATEKTVFGASQSGGTGSHRIKASIAGTSSNRMRSSDNPSEVGSTGTNADVSKIGTNAVTLSTVGIYVWTFDAASNTKNFYRNGTLDTAFTTVFTNSSSASISTPIPSADPKTIHLGSDGNVVTSGPSNTFSNGTSSNVGYIQEVHIFSQALTAAQVGTL